MLYSPHINYFRGKKMNVGSRVEKCLLGTEDAPEIKKQYGQWIWVDLFEEINIYTAKEMQELLHTSSFMEYTEELLEDGVFTREHYFTAIVKDEPREFWTHNALNILEQRLLISQEEEDDYASHYFFVRDSIGESAMAKEVTRRHNSAFPNDKRNHKTVKAFMGGSWTNFKTKNKKDVLLFLDQLKAIRRDIEQNIKFRNSEGKIVRIKKHITYEEVKI